MNHSLIDNVDKLKGLDISESLVFIRITEDFLQLNYNIIHKCSYFIRNFSKIIETRKQGQEFDDDFKHLTHELRELYENFKIIAKEFDYFNNIVNTGAIPKNSNPQRLTMHLKSVCNDFETNVERFSRLVEFILRDHKKVEDFTTYLDNLYELIKHIREDTHKLDEVLKNLEQMRLR